MQDKEQASSLIDSAFAAHQSGDMASARMYGEKALQLQADYPDALHLLGLVAWSEKDIDKALAFIERAVELDPDEPIFRINAAAIHEKRNDFQRVVEHLRIAAQRAPIDATIRMRLARAEVKIGDNKAASESYETVCRLAPDRVDAVAGFVRSKLLVGSTAEAFQAALTARRKWPGDISLLKLCCAAAIQARNWRELLEVSALWRRADASDLNACRSLAHAYMQLRDAPKARDAFEPVIKVAAPAVADLSAYARFCLAAFDYAEAERVLGEVRKLAPDHAELQFAQARYDLFTGDLEKSERHFLRTIELNPDMPQSYVHLVSIKNGDIDDAMLANMQRMADDSGKQAEHRAALFLAIGAALHRRSDYPKAMQAFIKGNALTTDLLALEGSLYDQTRAEEERRRDLAFFKSGVTSSAGDKAPATPIFILGAPRSGTTLIESVLAAHPEAFGAGELGALPVIHDAAVAWAGQAGVEAFGDIPEEQRKAWRNEYVSGWPAIGEKKYIIDKQPLNIRSVGLINALFPEAALVHIRRNPVETCFSIFRNDFSSGWPFACSLSDTAHYYGEYARQMEHWRRELNDEVLLLQYEDFVENFEQRARELIAHCGLDWSDACLEFHKAQRPVATFSAAQVRSPLARQKDRVLERYGDLLAPLIVALEEAGVDLTTGAYMGEE
ncbi:sulfotransferase [Marinicaulis aureus]|uniref:Sulfotransferase n=1 Tax=Hyphococcus aureus TaxID=2666033 RepID=A0ABW1KW70_9PROT